MRNPLDESTTGVSAAIAAELIVVIAIFLGAAITVNGHSIWAVFVGVAG